MKKIKFFICIIAVCFIVSVMTGCMFTEFSYYENFYNDMDIQVRLQDGLYKAEHKDTNVFFEDEIKTLKQDLLMFPEEAGEDARIVNDLFLSACDELLVYFDGMREGDTKKAQTAFENANLYFNEGNMRYHDFVVKYSL